MKVSELKTEMDSKFAAVDDTLEELRLFIKSDGEATRRHFDVVVERILGERNLALDRSMATAEQLVGLTASNAADHVQFEHRLNDHDRRLENIEKGSQRQS